MRSKLLGWSFVSLYSVMILGLLTACTKTIDDLEVAPVEPEYGIAIFQANVTLGDAYNYVDDSLSSFLTLDQNNVFSVEFDFEYSSEEAQTYFQFTDLGASETLSTTIFAGTTEGIEVVFPVRRDTLSVDFSSGSGLSDPDAELTGVDLKGGSVEIDLSCTLPHDFEIKIEMPGLTLNGTSWSTTVFFDYESGVALPMVQTISIPDLNGYSVDLSMASTTFNSIEYLISGVVTTEASFPSSQDVSFSYDVAVTDAEYSTLYGYVSEYEVPFDEQSISQTIEVFGDYGLEVFKLGDPQITLTTKNETGHKVNGVIDTLEFNYNTQGSHLLIGDYQTEFLVLGPASSPGEHSLGTSEISNNNSNLSEALFLEDGLIDFVFSAVVNQGGKVAGANYFIQDTSKIVVEANVKVPLNFKTTSELVFEDTMRDVSFDFGEDVDGFIKEVELKFSFKNGLPIDVYVQLYGYDAQGVFVDSILSEPLIIQSPDVDANGLAIGTNDYYYTINKTGTEVAGLTPITDLVYKVRAQTANKGADYVSLSTATGFSIGLGARVQLILDDGLLEE